MNYLTHCFCLRLNPFIVCTTQQLHKEMVSLLLLHASRKKFTEEYHRVHTRGPQPTKITRKADSSCLLLWASCLDQLRFRNCVRAFSSKCCEHEKVWKSQFLNLAGDQS